MRRSDYRAPSLHPNARDTRKARAAAAAAAAAATKSSSAPAVERPTGRTTGDEGDKGEDEDVMRLPESASSSDEDNAAEPRESQKLKRVYTSSMRKEELKIFKPDIKTIVGEEDEEGRGRRLEIRKPRPPPLEDTSSSTNARHILGLKGSPTRVARPSGSISSISSLSSLASLSPSWEESAKPARKKARKDDCDDTATEIVCTVCRKVFSVALLRDKERKMKSLSLQGQRDICHRHRLSEAQDVCRHRGYPAAAVDWAEVEGVRVPKLLAHLRQVLQRKVPCFYLEQLAAHAAAAKSKPKLLHIYLHSGVLDVVKPGYYGPKGQKVVCDAVTNALASELKQAARDDRVVRAAGVGAYVAAVLVPECTMRLVMEDIKTRSQDRARDVLAESSDIGRLLNPDDDHVEVIDGE
ncbi:hypothetical protein DV737_g2632, partial [Chaetothyriales sp. CBS 132003]